MQCVVIRRPTTARRGASTFRWRSRKAAEVAPGAFCVGAAAAASGSVASNAPVATPPEATVPQGLPTAVEAQWTMKRWADFAAKLCTVEIVERAQTLARQQMAQSQQCIMNMGTAAALAFGALAPCEADLPQGQQLEELFWRHLLLELGQALSTIDQAH